jgi:hypothetical protein
MINSLTLIELGLIAYLSAKLLTTKGKNENDND